MSMFANSALLGGGVRVRVWIREQRSKEDLRHYYAFDGKLGHHSYLDALCHNVLQSALTSNGSIGK